MDRKTRSEKVYGGMENKQKYFQTIEICLGQAIQFGECHPPTYNSLNWNIIFNLPRRKSEQQKEKKEN